MRKFLFLLGLAISTCVSAKEVIFRNGFEPPCETPPGMLWQTRGTVRWFPGGDSHNISYTDYRYGFGKDPVTGLFFDFPGVTGYVLSWAISRNNFAAIQFVPPDYGPLYTDRAFGAWTFQQTGSTSIASMSLDACPGNLNTAPLCRVVAKGEGAGVSWRSPSSPYAGCTVLPGETYYLNLMFVDDSNQLLCGTSSCTIGVKATRSVQ